MALSLEQNKEPKAKESKSAALLNKYLQEAVRLTNSDTIIEANRFLGDFAKRPRWEEIKQEDIQAKKKEIKEEMKKYGFRDKAAYYGNIKAGDHTKESLIKMGIVAATTVAASAISPDLGQVVAGIGMTYLMSKAAARTIGEPQTPKELFSTRDYADLKHQQIALRKLSHHLENKELKAAQQNAVKKGLYMPLYYGSGMGY